MKLHEIIDTLADGVHAIEYGKLHPYLKSLKTYYKAQFNSEPWLVPVAVFNAAQYCLIAPQGEIHEALLAYDSDTLEDDELLESYLYYAKPL